MQKTLLLAILFISFITNAQISTSEDEYAYLTKGIREQYANGLDIKKDGYTLEKFFERKTDNTTGVFTFYKFLDKDGNIKAISIMRKRPEGSASSGYYYCYPINNEKLMNKYMKLVDDNGAERSLLQATNEAMIYLLQDNK